jgi:hypothetical protein
MVLAYSGIQQTQIDIDQQLETIPHIGTPGFRIRLLASRRLEVIYRSGELADLRRALRDGVPPIVMVDTGELPYWEVATTHAVVLLAIDEKTVLLNDPDKEQAPIRVSLDDFELVRYAHVLRTGTKWITSTPYSRKSLSGSGCGTDILLNN